MVELTELVNSNDLIQTVNFPTQIPGCDSHNPALLDLFLYSDAIICSTMTFPSLGNSHHIFVSVVFFVFFYFLSKSKRQVPFHCIAREYYGADWEGPYDHLRDVPGRISLYSVLLLLQVNL